MNKCNVCKLPKSDLEMFIKGFHPVTIYACEDCLVTIANENAEESRKWNENYAENRSKHLKQIAKEGLES